MLLTREGYVEGWCDSTSLTVGDRFVILAEWTASNVLKASVTMRSDWIELPHYTRACGLQKMYPFGTNFILLSGINAHRE